MLPSKSLLQCHLIIARRAYCVVVQNFHVRVSVRLCASVVRLSARYQSNWDIFVSFWALFGTSKLQISPVKRSKSGPEKGPKSGRFWGFGIRFWTFQGRRMEFQGPKSRCFWGFGDRILKVSEAKNGVSGYQKWDISWHEQLMEALRATCPAGVI